MLDMINPHIAKILISIREEDSIRQVSKRINLSYGWTYYWCEKLNKKGVIKKQGKKIILIKNDFYNKTISFISEIIKKDLSSYYSIISLFGLRYAFCFTDAVFIWTKGGYNIARNKDNYPIFIRIHKKDLPLWKFYFRKLNLRFATNLKKRGIYYVLDIVENFKATRIDKTPTVPLQECIDFMLKHIYNFEPALEMVQEMYGKKLGIKYKH